VDKAALGQVFYEYFGFPSQSFHQFHHHHHPGLTQYADGGRSAEWTQLDSTVHCTNATDNILKYTFSKYKYV
jgi:hypothetical protein